MAERAGKGFDEFVTGVVASLPARRLGTPEEFGMLCAFLCSAHAGYVTNKNIVVDGGHYPSMF